MKFTKVSQRTSNNTMENLTSLVKIQTNFDKTWEAPSIFHKSFFSSSSSLTHLKFSLVNFLKTPSNRKIFSVNFLQNFYLILLSLQLKLNIVIRMANRNWHREPNRLGNWKSFYQENVFFWFLWNSFLPLLGLLKLCWSSWRGFSVWLCMMLKFSAWIWIARAKFVA